MNNRQLHELIRQSFEGRNRARLFFTLAEVTHAWRNIFREPLKARFGDGVAKPVSIALSVLGGLLLFAAVGSMSVLVLGVIG